MKLSLELKKKLLASFISELEDSLERGNASLLVLEKNNFDDECSKTNNINELLGIAHTLKGASQAADIGQISGLCHSLESLLSILNSGFSDVLYAEAMNALFQAFDVMEKVLKALQKDGEAGNSRELEKVSLVIDSLLMKNKPIDKEKFSANNLTPVDKISEKHDLSLKVAKNKVHSEVVSSERRDSADCHQKDTVKQSSDANNKVKVSAKKLDDLLAQNGELRIAWQKMSILRENLISTKNSIKDSHNSNSHFLDSKKIISEIDRNIFNFDQNIRVIDQALDFLDSEVKKIRMLPFESACLSLARTVRDLSKEMGKNIDFELKGKEIELDRTVLEGIRGSLLHIIRNAIDHGIEDPETREKKGKSKTAKITVEAQMANGDILITVTDDGQGINKKKVLESAAKKGIPVNDDSDPNEIIFTPGFSTASLITDISGRGIGLDAVRNGIHDLHGSIKLESEEGKGSCFKMNLPLTLSTLRSLIIIHNKQALAISTSQVDKLLKIKTSEIKNIEGRDTYFLNKKPVSVLSLYDLFGEQVVDQSESGYLSTILARINSKPYLIVVDRILNEQEIIVKNLGARLNNVSFLTGGTIFADGSVVLIANLPELIKNCQLRSQIKSIVDREDIAKKTKKLKRIILCDDSLTTRMLEKSILESAGYEVNATDDASKAWELLKLEGADLIVSDVEMPIMTGFELAKKIRSSEKFSEVPVILVTGLSKEADKIKGLESGANAYLKKGEFDQDSLLQAVEQLI